MKTVIKMENRATTSIVTSVVIITITTLTTISGQLNFTNISLPRQTGRGYKTMNVSRRNFGNTSGRWLFKDYIRKFNPNVVFNRIDMKKKAEGRNASVEQDFDAILEGIDPTDDLLRLNVEGVSGRRKWTPPGKADQEAPRNKDQFSLRRRFFELMKHTMYRTRNKLVIMQLMRTKFKDSKVYKMGFLMSKTDTACKSFAAYTYRLLHACIGRRYGSNDRHEVISLLTGEERLVNKWFEIELLIDLIVHNHEEAKKTIEQHESGRKEKWEFVD